MLINNKYYNDYNYCPSTLGLLEKANCIYSENKGTCKECWNWTKEQEEKEN